MNWGAVFGLSVIVTCMFLYEWPQMNQKQKKEKAAFLGLTAIGWMLGVVLVFFPDLPGPAQLFNNLIKPLGKMLMQ